ncbi:MAG: type II toxin-antitoxin system PemK/MazF family toxin [Proteobacteria bacterium]|nr:type II toxin-antitoxin system PemK/MazF family toxin [Pseudomonadota bacterium]
MAMVMNRFDVYLINLDSAVGSEIQKMRPCLIISPDEMNRHIRTVIVAPMTTAGKDYPTRIACRFMKKKGHIVLDQIRTIDKTRLIKNIGTIDSETQLKVISTLQQLFAF